MTDLAVRPYAPQDAPAWVPLNSLVFDRKATLEAFQEQEQSCPANQFMHRWVVAAGGESVGLASLYSFPFNPPGYLHTTLGVHPAYRHQGLGQKLWQERCSTFRRCDGSAPLALSRLSAKGYFLRLNGFQPRLSSGREVGVGSAGCSLGRGLGFGFKPALP